MTYLTIESMSEFVHQSNKLKRLSCLGGTIRHAVVWPVALLFLVSCATPPEVKQLSVAQIGYFDKAIEAVKIQSEALYMASEKIANEAKKRIDETEKAELAAFEKTILAMHTYPAAEQANDTKEVISSIAATKSTAERNKKNLDVQLEAIKAKSEELQNYLKKMKEVQVALDAYLQSEQAGEQVISNILGSPKVSTLLGKANDLLPKITGTTEELKKLLNSVK